MSNDSSRLIAFIILSGIILFTYNLLFPVKPKTQQHPATDKTTLTPTDTIKAITATQSLSLKQQKLTAISEKLYDIENELIKVTFSSIGAVIKSFQLKKYSDSKDENKKTNLELIPNKTTNTYMALFSKEFPLNEDEWTYLKTEKNNDVTKISFKYDKIKNTEIIKEFIIKNDSYLINMQFIFINKSNSPILLKDMQLSWGPNIHFLPADVNKYKDSFYQYNKIMYLQKNNSIKQYQINLNTKQDKITFLDIIPSWIVLKDLYFMTSFIFNNPDDIKNIFYKESTGGFTYLTVNLKDIVLEPKSTQTIKVDSYTGPQEYKRLKKLKMENIVDLGWFRFLGVWMFYAMDFLFKITKNYGWAIILLTIIVRIILWIPSQQSYKQMKDTQA
ncbi:MAG: membrane protein insertase YidC, partial [Candidatus Goldbacteria bacterium]|nr:membrane protein insertase YidC [Candidatus Goldiibacteriota bacterium]